MKYISIDIETTGLDPEKHQILEFAAVFDDLENVELIEVLPKFVRKICWEDFVISQYCLDLHGGKGLLQEIEDNQVNQIESPVLEFGDISIPTDKVIPIIELAQNFKDWLNALGITGSYNVAGKNFTGFDGNFLKKVPNFPPWFYRVIDVGSMYLEKSMFQVPSLSDIVGTGTKHRALDDALDVVRAVRKALL